MCDRWAVATISQKYANWAHIQPIVPMPAMKRNREKSVNELAAADATPKVDCWLKKRYVDDGCSKIRQRKKEISSHTEYCCIKGTRPHSREIPPNIEPPRWGNLLLKVIGGNNLDHRALPVQIWFKREKERLVKGTYPLKGLFYTGTASHLNNSCSLWSRNN